MLPAGIIRPTWVEVDLDALRHNARVVSQRAGAPLCAVVKANAYGHGVGPVARILAREPCVVWFAVSLVEEGIELRNEGIDKPIAVLGAGTTHEQDELVHHGLTAMVNHVDDVGMLETLGARNQTRVSAHLMLDTGMGRLGVKRADFARCLERAADRPHVHLCGLATHFACADIDDPGDLECMTHAQIAAFDDTRAQARERGLGSLLEPLEALQHMANSAAALRFPGTGRDMARPGLALYGNGTGGNGTGGNASGGNASGGNGSVGGVELRQVMRLCSRVAMVRHLEPGESVSYGALWRAPAPTRVAVLPVGYADGVPRRMTGSAEVLLHGQRMSVIGAITMDTILVDVTPLGDRVNPGDEAVLLGAQGDECIRTAEFAERAGCIEYEVTCGISRRVPRVYRDAMWDQEVG